MCAGSSIVVCEDVCLSIGVYVCEARLVSTVNINVSVTIEIALGVLCASFEQNQVCGSLPIQYYILNLAVQETPPVRRLAAATRLARALPNQTMKANARRTSRASGILQASVSCVCTNQFRSTISVIRRSPHRPAGTRQRPSLIKKTWYVVLRQ